MPEGFFPKKVRIFTKFSLYIWVNSCYDYQAGQRPDAITMPVAQFREKAVFQYTTHPLLGSEENFLKGGNFP
jgi:hypothetical protein